MADNQRPIRIGIWYLIWRGLLIIILTLVMHIMMSSWVWHDKHEHVHQILLSDFQNIQVIDSGHSAYQRALEWSKNAFYWSFEASGFNKMIRDFSTPKGFNPPDTELRKLIVHFWSEIQTAMFSVQIIGERLSVIFSIWPLVLMISIAALSDGWAARWLRREKGGRESAFLYHRLKRGVFLSMLTMCGVYLMWPSHIDPRFVIFPFILIYAVLLRFTITYFKKYF